MSALDDYKSKHVTMKAAWTPPTMADFAAGVPVLSFDQSLANTGWLYFSVREAQVLVHARGTLRTSSSLTGWRANFAQAEQIAHAMGPQVDDKLMEAPEEVPRFPEAVVLELPSAHGHRTDSSMLAAYEIDRYSRTWWMPTLFMAIQKSRTILGGSNIRNDKKGGHKALARYLPESASRQWNEHQRDAAINGLAYLHELKQNEGAQE